MYGQRNTDNYGCNSRDGFNRFNPASMRNYWGPPPSGPSYYNRGPTNDSGGGRRQPQNCANVRTRSCNDRHAAPSGPAGIVREILRKNPILMVAFSYCPACKKLAAVLDEQHIRYRMYEVDRLPNKTEIMEEFEKISGICTAPQMYIKGRFIGDGSTTRGLIASGEFHKMIGRKNEINIMNAPELVCNVLQKHPVLMMSFTYCPCCKNLAKKLDAARICYYKFEVDELPNRSEIITQFERLSGIRTAPQMFVAGEFVGDGSTTGELIATGELQRIIRSQSQGYQ